MGVGKSWEQYSDEQDRLYDTEQRELAQERFGEMTNLQFIDDIQQRAEGQISRMREISEYMVERREGELKAEHRRELKEVYAEHEITVKRLNKKLAESEKQRSELQTMVEGLLEQTKKDKEKKEKPEDD